MRTLQNEIKSALEQTKDLEALLALANMDHHEPKPLGNYPEVFKVQLKAATVKASPAINEEGYTACYQFNRDEICEYAAYIYYKHFINNADNSEQKKNALKAIAEKAEQDTEYDVRVRLNINKKGLMPAEKILERPATVGHAQELRNLAAKKYVELKIEELPLKELVRLGNTHHDPKKFLKLLNDPIVPPVLNDSRNDHDNNASISEDDYSNEIPPLKIIKLGNLDEQNEILRDDQIQELIEFVKVKAKNTIWESRIQGWKKLNEAPKDASGQVDEAQVKVYFGKGILARGEFEDKVLPKLLEYILETTDQAQIQHALTTAKTNLGSQNFLSGQYTYKLNDFKVTEIAKGESKVETTVTSPSDTVTRKKLFRLALESLKLRFEAQGMDPATQVLVLNQLPTYKNKNGLVEEWNSSSDLQRDFLSAAHEAGFNISTIQYPAEVKMDINLDQFQTTPSPKFEDLDPNDDTEVTNDNKESQNKVEPDTKLEFKDLPLDSDKGKEEANEEENNAALEITYLDKKGATKNALWLMGNSAANALESNYALSVSDRNALGTLDSSTDSEQNLMQEVLVEENENNLENNELTPPNAQILLESFDKFKAEAEAKAKAKANAEPTKQIEKDKSNLPVEAKETLNYLTPNKQEDGKVVIEDEDEKRPSVKFG